MKTNGENDKTTEPLANASVDTPRSADKEITAQVTRRALLLRAGWAIPVILATQLPRKVQLAASPFPMCGGGHEDAVTKTCSPGRPPKSGGHEDESTGTSSPGQ